MCKISLILEEPISALLAKTGDNFGLDRAFNGEKVRIATFEVIPAVNNSQIQFNFKTKTTGKTYETTIVFDNVEYINEPSPQSVTVKAVDGSDYHIIPLSHNSSDVKVRCTCLDFYYRFAAHNKASNSLHGDAPPPYIKKTNRPQVNPKKVSGYCKHIIGAVDYIANLNIIK